MKKSKSALVANSKKEPLHFESLSIRLFTFFLLSHLANESRTDP